MCPLPAYFVFHTFSHVPTDIVARLIRTATAHLQVSSIKMLAGPPVVRPALNYLISNLVFIFRRLTSANRQSSGIFKPTGWSRWTVLVLWSGAAKEKVIVIIFRSTCTWSNHIGVEARGHTRVAKCSKYFTDNYCNSEQRTMGSEWKKAAKLFEGVRW